MSFIEPIISSGTLVYNIVDFRVGDFGVPKFNGLDWQTSYRHTTGFRAGDFAFNGNYALSRKFQASQTAPTVDDLQTNNLIRLPAIGRR